MSIIYDALKKVERSTTNQLPVQRVESKSKLKIYLLYALVAIGGIFIANAVFKTIESSNNTQTPPLQNLTTPTVETIKPVQELTLPVSSQETLPAITPQTKETPDSPDLILNGIFFSNNDGYALVNNQIVRIGDTVAGAQVKKITSNEVELDLRGQTIKLSAK